MKDKIPTNLTEIKSSLGNWKETFSSTFKQLVEKGKELQQVTEQLFTSPIVRDFPKMDIVEGTNELFVVLELPGMTKDDFQLEIGSGMIFLRGEKKNPLQNKAGGIHILECSYGKFERNISLPCKIVEDKVEAEFKNGVLTISLIKAEGTLSKRIPVNIR